METAKALDPKLSKSTPEKGRNLTSAIGSMIIGGEFEKVGANLFTPLERLAVDLAGKPVVVATQFSLDQAEFFLPRGQRPGRVTVPVDAYRDLMVWKLGQGRLIPIEGDIPVGGVTTWQLVHQYGKSLSISREYGPAQTTLSRKFSTTTRGADNSSILWECHLVPAKGFSRTTWTIRQAVGSFIPTTEETGKNG